MKFQQQSLVKNTILLSFNVVVMLFQLLNVLPFTFSTLLFLTHFNLSKVINIVLHKLLRDNNSVQVLMTLKAKKDFMVFINSVIYCEVVYCSWLFVRSKLCLPQQRKTRSLCHCFVILGFSRKTSFASK